MYTVLHNGCPSKLRLFFEAQAPLEPEPISTGVQLQSPSITNVVVQLAEGARGSDLESQGPIYSTTPF